MNSTRLSPALLLCMAAAHIVSPGHAQDAAENTVAPDVAINVADNNRSCHVIRDAFLAVHGGWSTDEVLLQDDLNRRFVEACRARDETLSATECNWGLLTLRKAGKLSFELTRRRHDQHDDYRHAAEIAARWIEDQFEMNTDRALCDLEIRRRFDEKAQSIAPRVEPYLLRKAALSLRKSRQLRPEYVARVADWDRELSEWTVGELRTQLGELPEAPGVYVFRDRTGYLYIGEAANLAVRLKRHLDRSDRTALANYLADGDHHESDIVVELHVFDPASEARLAGHRRAYESDLISRRKPRFNVRP